MRAAGGAPRLLTESLDRSVGGRVLQRRRQDVCRSLSPTIAPVYLASSAGRRRPIERVARRQPRRRPAVAREGPHRCDLGTSTEPTELYAVENKALRKLTSHNDALVAELQLQPAEDIAFKSKDGTEIHGLLTKPAGYVAGRRYPTLFRLHGGPTAQDAHSFNFERQIFAANGYVVVNVNYRGSSGRGAKFQEAIFADWGNLEVQDVLAAVDYVVAQGIADPARLGIGGWSYGGVLTDYVIASDTRFKAAISGAGSANHISLYGHDQYTFLYDNEFGPPWKNVDLWIKFSYPFFKADRITTPTLFMGGQNDFNVPILGQRAAVSGAQDAERSDAARRVSGPEPWPDQGAVPPRSDRALPRVVRQVPSASSVNERAGTAGAVAIEAGTGRDGDPDGAVREVDSPIRRAV